MNKIILTLTALLITTTAVISAQAQETDKKPPTTSDAWRQALPDTEQTSNTQPFVIESESRDNVEIEETPAQIETRVLNLEQRLMNSLQKRDAVMLKHLIAENFIIDGVTIAGTQPDKVRYVDWALKSFELKSFTFDKPTVKAFQTAAIIKYNYKQQANVSGAANDGDFAVVDTWVKIDKRWQIASRQINKITKP